jgi:uncharacterized protein
MEYIITCLVAFFGSGLTLFSGFGLGTLLIPAFGLFFPIDVAIALTAIVHFLNNIFKLILLGRHANKEIIIRFGIPSVIAAFAGAYLLTTLTDLPPIAKYVLQGKIFSIMPVKTIIGTLMIFFALLDIVPALAKIQFDKKYLPVGGLISGFIGGLSGHQGALRSAFLIRANLTKEAFIASGVVIACMTDVSRLTVYAEKIFTPQNEFNYPLIISATLCAFAGAYLGNKFVKKMTVKALQLIVAVMLIVFGVLLGVGII